jgi:hypothetical protein
MLRGTVLGAADFTVYYTFEDNRVAVKDDTFVPIPRDQCRTLRMEDQVDAVLDIGSPSEITYRDLSPTLCDDAAYMKMRLERFALVGLPQAAADRLKDSAPELHRSSDYLLTRASGLLSINSCK